ncbi:MAG: class I SAM-dependent methyltransferase [Clostridia bacterium]|nr:class I SAM-dependent methyltransferase [Clostridia bacterium]
MSYEYSFASCYDVFTDGVNYSDRADYICSLMEKNGISEGTILDTACGTGSLSEMFLKKGFEVVANDISYNMLNIAREKLSVFGDKVLLLCQDMCELDLYGTVDAAVCSLDSINHLIEEDEVEAAFLSIGKFIRPDGLFIFDINTLYKHRSVLSGNTFVYEDDENTFLVWQNSECDSDDVIEMFIDIFSKDDDGRYIRQNDYIIERAYSVDFLKNTLINCGFEVLGVYGDMKLTSPQNDEERIYFLAKKK